MEQGNVERGKVSDWGNVDEGQLFPKQAYRKPGFQTDVLVSM